MSTSQTLVHIHLQPVVRVKVMIILINGGVTFIGVEERGKKSYDRVTNMVSPSKAVASLTNEQC